MSGQNQFDVVVIGGGPGGYVAALRAAQQGLSVAVVEDERLGGTCLNEGCIPSKALLHAAEVSRSARGHVPGLPSLEGDVDMPALQDWKRSVVAGLRSGVGSLLASARVEVVDGYGRLDGPGRVAVTTADEVRILVTTSVVIAAGSRPRELPHLPLDGRRVVGSSEALEFEAVPPRVTVVGAGYIGLELVTAYEGLGSQVTVVEIADRVLEGIHAGCARLVHDRLVDRGVEVLLDHRIAGVSGTTLRLEGPASSTRALEADVVIVAVGRDPNSADLGLASVGLEPDADGFLATDDRMETAVPRVYAIGDIVRGPALAHRASAQGELVADVLAGSSHRFQPVAIPAIIFTDPEVGSVGMTLQDATARGIDAQEHRLPLSTNARALLLGDDGGAVHIVSEVGTELLLGVHAVGPGVGAVTAAACIALEMGAVLDDVADTILPHPTVGEAFVEAALLGRGTPIHVPSPQRSSGRATTGRF